VDLIKSAFLHYKKGEVVYHVRYLKSGLIAFVRYGLVIALSKLGLFRLMWTCHNIEEHNYNHSRRNRLLRKWLAANAGAILVLHEDLKSYLPASARSKVFVASFGDMSAFVERQLETNPDFTQALTKWDCRKSDPFVLSVSTAKKNNLQLAVDGVKLAGMAAVLIAPEVEPPAGAGKDDILFYNRAFVRQEVKGLLLRKNAIGYVGHSNISVPTSLFMFASFGVPVIGFDIKPVSSLIQDSQIGVVVSTPEEFAGACSEIVANYETYAANCSKLLSKYSWRQAAEVHQKALQEL